MLAFDGSGDAAHRRFGLRVNAGLVQLRHRQLKGGGVRGSAQGAEDQLEVAVILHCLDQSSVAPVQRLIRVRIGFTGQVDQAAQGETTKISILLLGVNAVEAIPGGFIGPSVDCNL